MAHYLIPDHPFADHGCLDSRLDWQGQTVTATLLAHGITHRATERCYMHRLHDHILGEDIGDFGAVNAVMELRAGGLRVPSEVTA